MIANVKHFAANNQEGDGAAGARRRRPASRSARRRQGNRMTVDAIVDERTLREIYLPQFEAAVKEAQRRHGDVLLQPLNGQYACENRHLLKDILESEWGFKGFVLADYGAAHDTATSLNNGLDFEPWPGSATPRRRSTPRSPPGREPGARSTSTCAASCARCSPSASSTAPPIDDDDSQIDKAAHAQIARAASRSRRSRC